MISASSRRKFGSCLVLSLFVLGLALLSKPAAAQDYDDPPGRVARLNYMQGSVSYQVSGNQDWVQADPNRPLTTGDNLWVDQDSRGEVHIGSTAIRLSSQTGVSFLTLDDRTVQLQLAQGAIEIHVRRLDPGDDFEIDTPNLAFTLTRGGEYRIQTDPDGDTTSIIVREGEGEVTGGGDSWELRAGRLYTFGGSDELSYDASPAPGYDDFEDWCESRDQRENASLSSRYVSRDVDGYYDLDEYGDWRSDPDYGPVWIPRGVEVGWAPYQVGHWVYVAPWGWTWVDAEPWGFAPFHYGRWVFVGGYWGWVPGPIVVRPVYAPALVAFVGGGGFGVSVSFGGGFSGVGWFPLGPRDVYVPGYRCSQRYVQNVNVTNTRVINVTQVTNVYNTVYINHDRTGTNNYTYARNDRAVTAVSRDTFMNARPISTARVRVSTDQIQRARAVENAPIAPTRGSYISSTAKVVNNRPAVPFTQRAVVARLTPKAERPVNQPSQNRPGFQPFGNAQRGDRGNNQTVDRSNRGGNAPNVTNPPQNQQTIRGNNPPPGISGGGNQPDQPLSRDSRQTQQPSRNTQQQQNPPQSTQGQQQQGQQQGQQPSRDGGYRPFQRPEGETNPPSGTSGSNTQPNQPLSRDSRQTQQPSQPSTQGQQQQQQQQRPQYRYAPPPKARDDNYDVHPPLNQQQTQQQTRQDQKQQENQARQEQKQEQRQQKEQQKQDDKKNDDNKH